MKLRFGGQVCSAVSSTNSSATTFSSHIRDDEGPSDLRIERLRVLLSIGNREAFEDELEFLDLQSLTPKQANTLQLLHGDFLLTDQAEYRQGRTLLNSLRQRMGNDDDLDEVDRHYLEGLTAKSLELSTTALRQAVKVEPTHARASLTLVVNLILSAQWDEAELEVARFGGAFPESDAPYAMAAMLYALSDNKPKLNTSLENLRNRFLDERFNETEQQLQKAREKFKRTESVMRMLNTAISELNQSDSSMSLVNAWLSIAKLVYKLQLLSSESDGLGPLLREYNCPTANWSFELSEKLFQALNPLGSTEKTLDEIIEIHPDALFKYWRSASILKSDVGEFFKENPTPEEINRQIELTDRNIEVFREVVESPTAAPYVLYSARFFMLVLLEARVKYYPEAPPHPLADEKLRWVPDLVDLGRRFPNQRSMHLKMFAAMLPPETVKFMLRSWQVENPDDKRPGEILESISRASDAASVVLTDDTGN